MTSDTLNPVRVRAMLLAFVVVSAAPQYLIGGTIDWDGDCAVGDFNCAGNWYGNSNPNSNGGWHYGNDLVFNFRNNSSQTSLYFNYGGWRNIGNIRYASTFLAALPFDGDGNGLDFNQKFENYSAFAQTINIPLSGAKNGATRIELNPVSGDLTFTQPIYNENNKPFYVYGSNSKMLTIANTLGGDSSVSFNIAEFSKVKFAAAQSFGSSSSANVNIGELWFASAGGLASGMTVNLGLADANAAKLWLASSGVNFRNNISVNNTTGSKVMGGLNSSGVVTFGGSVALNGTTTFEANQSGGLVEFTNVISGSGHLRIPGPGTVRLSGNNTMSGGITVSGGKLIAAHASALGSGPMTNSSTLEITNATITSPNLTLNNGAIVIGSGANAEYSKSSYPSIGNGASVMFCTSNSTDLLKIRSAVRNGNSSSTITLAGSGTVHFDAGSASGTTYAGSWVLLNGTLLLTDATALGNLNGSSPRPIMLQGGIWTWRVTSSLAAYPVTVSADATIQPNLPSSGAGITHNLGTLSIGSAQLSASPGANVSSGTMTLAFGATTLSGNAIFNLNKNGNANINVSLGAVSESGGVRSLTKSGTGVLTLTTANTYSGDTTVSAGTLAFSSSATVSSSPTLLIASGAVLDASALSALTLANAQTLKGSGTITGAVSVANGSVLAPGSSVGVLTNRGAVLLQSGGTLQCEVVDATNSAGVGYDQASVAGDVGVLSTSPSKFTIKLLSLTNGFTAGLVTNFNNNSNYTWTVITNIAGAVTNFSSNSFTVDNTSLSNDLSGGTFSVETNNGIVVRFTANRAPMAGNTNFNRGPGLSLKIKIADLLSIATSDADGDSRQLTAIGATTNSGTVSQDGTYIYYTPPAAGGNDAFTYTIRDSRTYRSGDTVRTATGTITITKANAGGIAYNISTSGGTATINFAGIPGFSYDVERSTNLTSWDVITTLTAGSNGLFTFTDNNPPENSAYYRLRQH